MRLGRRRQEPPTVKQMEARAEDELYGDYAREPFRRPLLTVSTRSAPLEAIRLAQDEELAWRLHTLPAATRRLMLR